MAEKKTGAGAHVTCIRGVGEKRAESFAKLGASTVGELVYHFPRGYENRGNVKNIDEVEKLLAGIRCRGNTSCPDQLSQAITAYKRAKAEKEKNRK